MKINELFLSFKKEHNFPNLLIVQYTSLIDFKTIINNYLKSITCDQMLFCNECNNCKRINNELYIDLIWYDNLENKVKKENIKDIQDKFSKDSFEQKKVKLYAINLVENLNQQSLNSLLKFIEEPPKNTYAIFFTKNYNKIISTIKSRGFFFNLNINEDNQYLMSQKNENVNELINQLLNLNYKNEYQLVQKIKSLSSNELDLIIDSLINQCSLNKKNKLIELNNELKLNLNKSLIGFKILEILKWEQ